MKEIKIKTHNLYLIITEEHGKGRGSFEIAEAAIKGGVDIVQMREKDKTRQELIDLGKKLSRLCKDNGVIFIVNDDPAMAVKTDADGVHLGQEDIKKCSIEAARAVLGRDKIIGISTHSMEDFKKACAEDVDYIVYGPVFPTKIKGGCVGTGDVGRIMAIANKPAFFIGGITLKNVDSLLEKGARNISLIRAITEAEDIASATKNFREKLDFL